MKTSLLMGTLCLVLGLPAVAVADEKISFEQLPAAVKTAVSSVVGDLPIHEIELERRATGVRYEVEYFREGQKWEIELDEAGTVLQHEPD